MVLQVLLVAFSEIHETCFFPIDSKVLSEEKRDELFKVISLRKELLGWKVEIISPNYISNAMLQRQV